MAKKKAETATTEAPEFSDAEKMEAVIGIMKKYHHADLEREFKNIKNRREKSVEE